MLTEARHHWLVAPGRLELQAQTLDDQRLRDDEVLCRTLYSAISPGTELAAFSGLEPLRPAPAPYPRWLGYMNVAEVLAAGAEAARRFPPGAAVYTHAAHRSHYVVAAASVLAPLPAGVDPAAASLAYLYRLAWSGLRRGRDELGQRIGVVGLGAIGQCAVQVARAFAREVIGVSDHASARALAQAQGAAVQARAGARERFDAMADEARCDFVLVTTNGWADWEIALAMTRFGAIVSVLGFPGRGEPPPPANPLAARYFYDRQLALLGAGKAAPRLGDGAEAPAMLHDDVRTVLDWIAQGRVDPRPLCIGLHPALDLAGAYARLQSAERAPGTLVLDWRT